MGKPDAMIRDHRTGSSYNSSHFVDGILSAGSDLGFEIITLPSTLKITAGSAHLKSSNS